MSATESISTFNFIFEMLSPFYWFMSIGGVLLLCVMPFVGNSHDKELNRLLIFQIISCFCLSIILLSTGHMFRAAPEMAGVFLQSFFIAISDNEKDKLQQLHISPKLLILNSVAIGVFSYSAFKAFEIWIEHYSSFLARPMNARKRFFNQKFKGSTFGKNWRFLMAFVFQAMLISLIFRSCGITAEQY